LAVLKVITARWNSLDNVILGCHWLQNCWHGVLWNMSHVWPCLQGKNK